ncbi:MAG: hypothetical protein ACRDNW_23510 [Trebonia sp.]
MLEVADRQVGHPCPVVEPRVDQALGFEEAERLPHRSPADPELGSDPCLG